MSLPPLSWWIVPALSSVGFAALWWFVRGRQRASRLRGMKGERDRCGRADSPAEQGALDRLRMAPRAARRRGGGEPAPRFMFLGDAAAQMPRLSPNEAGDSASAAFWRWTVMPSMTAITVDPHALAAPDAPAVRRAWCHALLALMQEHRRLPLNGIVVCLDARGLQRAGHLLHAESARLRRLIDAAAQHLQLRFPVYLLVTGLERLSGYDVVRRSLPDRVCAQALGHRLPEDAPAHASDVFAVVTGRLKELRMALLRTHPAARDRMAIHDFVESVRSMGTGLEAAAGTLFENAADGQPAQPWRGLYLMASEPDGDVFAADLFGRFLPADRLLARSAATSPRRS